MKIGKIIDWYVNINVGDKVGRGNIGRVDSDIYSKFGTVDGEGVE